MLPTHVSYSDSRLVVGEEMWCYLCMFRQYSSVSQSQVYDVAELYAGNNLCACISLYAAFVAHFSRAANLPGKWLPLISDIFS